MNAFFSVTMTGILSDVQRKELAAVLTQLDVVSCTITCECCACHQLLLSNWKLPCRHTFCDNCYQGIKEFSSVYCHLHGQRFTHRQVEQDVAIDREVASIRVHCLNWREGCQAVLTLDAFTQHDKCAFQRDRLQKALDLPTKTQVNTFRVQFKEKNEEFFRPFVQPLRQHFADIVEQATASVAENDQSVNGNDDERSNTEDFQKTLHLTIQDFEQQLQSQRMESCWLNVEGTGFSFRGKIQMKLEEHHLRPFLRFEQLIGKMDVSPCLKSLTIFRLDKETVIKRIEDICFGAEKWKIEDVTSFQPIPIQLVRDFVKDDCLHLLVTLKHIQVHQITPFKWSLCNMKAKITAHRQGLSECVDRSDYFYSSLQGYRMQATLLIAQDNWLELYIDFLAGQWDNQLPGHYPHKVIVNCIVELVDESRRSLIRQCCDEEGHLFGDRIPRFISADDPICNLFIEISLEKL